MNKLPYSLWQNTRYVIQDFWGWQKKLVIMPTLHIPLVVILPLLAALIPKVIIDLLARGGGAAELLIAIPLMTVIAIFLYISENVTKLWVGDGYIRFRYRYLIRINEKTMDMDYELVAQAQYYVS